MSSYHNQVKLCSNLCACACTCRRMLDAERQQDKRRTWDDLELEEKCNGTKHSPIPPFYC